ncbi:MAG: hypothetical protein IPN67_00955 [Bacteroidales bacterium]|nr:hypothetical protein [Bacteroidales bacterium]MBK8880984.1 hypothetical protein [Bacteroidales bacterium]
MKKIFPITLMLALLFSVDLSGQLTTRQAGVRMGYRGGIYYQVSSETGNAETGYNAMLSFNNRGVQITGLKIIYENTLSSISPNLFFGWGYGGHAGFIYSDHLRSMGEDYYFHDNRFCPLIGLDGWLAAEYRIRDIPVIVSLNLKPYFEITAPAFVRLMPGDFGLSISYVF